MVRKVKGAFLACVIVAAICATHASAASPYEGNISTTYLTIFRDVVADLPIGDDYVFYRSGEYEYAMVTGDLDFDGSTFRLNGTGHEYILTYSGGYQSNRYNWNTHNKSSFSLSVGDHLVYSNLGNYPMLEGRESVYAFSTLVLVASACVASVLRYLFRFNLRSRAGA